MKKLMHRNRVVVGVVFAVVVGGSLSVYAGDPAFTNQAAAANIDVQQIASLSFQWSNLNTYTFVGGGAIGDFDHDGWPDLYVITGGSSPDRLYMNNGDGTFTDRAGVAGLGAEHAGMGAAAGDYDNDGDLDLFVTSYGPAAMAPGPGHHKLWQNDGHGVFTNVAVSAGVHFSNPYLGDGFGAAFGDYDLDGDLDLVVPHWLAGVADTLFRNDGNGVFSDVSVAAGIHDPTSRSYSACFADMNGDRYPELLIAGDYGKSYYYVNNGDGTFTDATIASGTGLDDNGMGHALGDLNNDGLLDWFVTGIHTLVPAPDIPGTGNRLYLNLGNHSFSEISQSAGVNDGGWGWGTVATDVDHDGWLDLFEANGWGARGEWGGEACYLFRNQANSSFSDVAAVAGADYPGQGRGAIRFDYDCDGDQDVVVLGYETPVALLRNDLVRDATTNWLRVQLDSSAHPLLAPDGYGARVVASVGGVSWTRSIAGGSGYNSQSELSAHFGLGSSVMLDELRVEWPDQTTTVLASVAANQLLKISSDGSHTAFFVRGDCNRDGGVNTADAVYLLGRLFLSVGTPIVCEDACDGSDNGSIDLSDAVTLLSALFVPGNPLPHPRTQCGLDVTPDSIACATYDRCP